MKVLKWVDLHLEEAILTICLLGLTCLVSLNALLRYVFNSSLTWSDEVCKYCLIYSGFISIGWWIRRNKGISVDALIQILPGSVKKILGIIVQIIVLLFFLLCFKGSVNVMNSMAESGQVSGTLQISMTYVYMAPVLGFGLAVIRCIQMFILYFTKKGEIE